MRPAGGDTNGRAERFSLSVYVALTSFPFPQAKAQGEFFKTRRPETPTSQITPMRPLLCVVAALAVGAAADDYASLESTPFAGIAPFAEVAHRPLARQLTRHHTVPSQLDNHSPSM